MRTTIALALIALGTTATPAMAGDGVKLDDKGVTLETGDLELNLGGRLHLDAAVFDDPVTGDAGVTDARVRRARLELSGRVGTVLRFRVDREFAGAAKGWRNVWASAEPVDGLEIKGGNMVVPFSGEDLQSSNSLPFAERSLASSLTPGLGLGGSVTASGKHWSLAAGYYTDALDNEDGQSAERGKGFVVRGSFAPVNRKDSTAYLAVAAERRTFDAVETMRFSADPGSALAPALMSSGGLAGIDHAWAFSGEAGVRFGSVMVQAQAVSLSLDRPLLGDLDFNGQTVTAAWLITGERYGFAEKGGYFSGPELSKRGSAVELAVRYSRLDLRDGAFDRGIGRAASVGANWYIGRNLRLVADWTESRVRFAGGLPSRRNHVGVIRLQANF